MYLKPEKRNDTSAYDVLHQQTQTLINFLYIFVMSILPFLWFGDCKRTMSLLFKHIQMPNYYEEHESQVNFHRNLQIFLILVGIVAYWRHRSWRLYSHNVRADILQRESSFTETKELLILKQKLLDRMNCVIEDKISMPLKRFGTSLSKLGMQSRACTMDGIAEEMSDNEYSPDANANAGN